MIETTIILLLFLAGLGTSRFFLQSFHPVFNAAVAFPIGSFVWVVCYILVYFSPFPVHSPLPFDIHLAFTLFCIVTVLLVVLSGYFVKFTKKEIFTYLIALGGIIGICMVSFSLIIFALTPDSYMFLGGMQDFKSTLRWGGPIFYQCVQALSLLIDDDYILSTIPQFVALSLAIMMACIVFWEVQQQTSSSSPWYGLYLRIVSLFPALLLFSAYIGFFMVFYQNHHLFTASFIFLFATSCRISVTEKNSSAIYIGIIALIAFTFTRMEALLFTSVLLPIFLCASGISDQQQRRASTMFLLGILPWHLYIASILGVGDFLSRTEYFIMIFLNIASTISFQINRWKPGKYVLKNSYLLIPLSLAFVFLLFIKLQPRYVLEHVTGTFLVNLFGVLGGWGLLWYVVAYSPILIFILRPSKFHRYGVDLFFSGWIASVLLALCIFVARYLSSEQVWGTLGFTNSTNRIMFHFVPFIFVWIIVQIELIIGHYIQKINAHTLLKRIPAKGCDGSA